MLFISSLRHLLPSCRLVLGVRICLNGANWTSIGELGPNTSAETEGNEILLGGLLNHLGVAVAYDSFFCSVVLRTRGVMPVEMIEEAISGPGSEKRTRFFALAGVLGGGDVD